MTVARRKVLLLGSTGAVGRGCLDLLVRRADLAVVIAGRDDARLRDLARDVARTVAGTPETVRLDAADAAAVATAVTGHDVVINCAGPAQRLSAAVAEAAVAAGVPYVDPGGDQALLDRIEAKAPAVPVVLQAGVQPGLSGLLLRALALRHADRIDRIDAWCGGLQPLTAASVLEYAASLHDTHGHPGAALRDGVIRRIGPGDGAPAPTRYFTESATVHPHLDSETISVAAYLGIDNVCWMNVFDGAHTTRAMHQLAAGEHTPRIETVLSAAKLDLFGRKPYFAIVGSADGPSGATTVAFTCPDSYRVTGALAAFAAQQVAGLPAGVRPFWSIGEPWRVLDFVAATVPGSELCVTDGALVARTPPFERTSPFEKMPPFEEGAL